MLDIIGTVTFSSVDPNVLDIAERSVFILGREQQQRRLTQVRIRRLRQARPAQQVRALRHAVHVNVWRTYGAGERRSVSPVYQVKRG